MIVFLRRTSHRNVNAATKRTKNAKMLVVGEYRFASRAALKRALVAALAEAGETDDLESANPASFALVWAALQRHPDANERLRGVARVRVERVRAGASSSTLGVALAYADGREEPVSLLQKCVYPERAAVAGDARPGDADPCHQWRATRSPLGTAPAFSITASP